MQSEAAHHVIPFLNFSWDHRKIEFSYTHDQIVSLPLGMRSYKVILFLSPTFGTDLFLNHEQIPKFCRLYCFGDRKTIENSSAFVNKLSNPSLSFKQSSLQAEIFLDTFKLVMFLPGDWHTGLNMLMSIYKIFWSDLLKPFQDLLRWKRLLKGVRSCYFQASCLV